jgi:heme A synthase
MGKRYTASELDARLKFGVGITLAAVLFTTTVAILYALVFVTQPIGEQAENDKMFFSVLSSIATFITGTLAGLMIGQNKAAVDPDPQPTTDEFEVEEGGEQQ